MLPLPNIDLIVLNDPVIWGFRANEIAVAAKADLTSVFMELKGNWTRRWEAVGMLKYLFTYANLPWALKWDGISFLASMIDGIVSDTYNDSVDYSSHMPTMYTSLKVGWCCIKSVLFLHSQVCTIIFNIFVILRPSKWLSCMLQILL